MNSTRPTTLTGQRLAVRFIRRWQVYFAGDVATFPARMSMALVEREIAEPVNIVSTDQPPEGAVWALRPPGEAPARRRGEDDILDL